LTPRPHSGFALSWWRILPPARTGAGGWLIAQPEVGGAFHLFPHLLVGPPCGPPPPLQFLERGPGGEVPPGGAHPQWMKRSGVRGGLRPAASPRPPPKEGARESTAVAVLPLPYGEGAGGRGPRGGSHRAEFLGRLRAEAANRERSPSLKIQNAFALGVPHGRLYFVTECSCNVR
jgi:hypothetical protein